MFSNSLAARHSELCTHSRSVNMAEGGLLQGTPIVVDNFQSRALEAEFAAAGFDSSQCPLIYFLTHGHADHTTGLSSSWNFGKLYCSATTKQILLDRLDLAPELIHVINPGETVVIPLHRRGMHGDVPSLGEASERGRLSRPLLTRYLDRFISVHGSKERKKVPVDSSNSCVTVTAFDANHCPGSVMFLFEGYFGTFLHTGDFSYHPARTDSVVSYLNARGNTDTDVGTLKTPSFLVDRLYLDSTYLHPRYRFLSQCEVVDRVEAIARLHDSRCTIYIGGDTLGKEDLLMAISRRLQSLIVLEPARFEGLSSIGMPIDQRERHFTLNSSEGFIHLISKRRVTLYNMEKRSRDAVHPVVGILIQGWACDNPETKLHPEQKLYRIPYSSHSDFPGIKAFVAAVRPRSVVCTVPIPGHQTVSTSLSLKEYFGSCCCHELRLKTPPVFMLQRGSPMRGPAAMPRPHGAVRVPPPRPLRYVEPSERQQAFNRAAHGMTRSKDEQDRLKLKRRAKESGKYKKRKKNKQQWMHILTSVEPPCTDAAPARNAVPRIATRANPPPDLLSHRVEEDRRKDRENNPVLPKVQIVAPSAAAPQAKHNPRVAKGTSESKACKRRADKQTKEQKLTKGTGKKQHARSIRRKRARAALAVLDQLEDVD